MNAYAQKEQKASSEKDKTGIPAQMKAKFERSSGFSFDDVRVHYNSEKPAQLHAHAYTQGSEVFVAPGQEKHLPHELGHVVQQKSNAVKPTGEIGGMPLNDDEAMESGADKLAEEAESSEESDEMPVQAKAKDDGVVQRIDLTSEGSYNFNAGFMSSLIGGVGVIGGLISYYHSSKEKYVGQIEKYTDEAEDACADAEASYYEMLSANNIAESTKKAIETKKHATKAKQLAQAAYNKYDVKRGMKKSQNANNAIRKARMVQNQAINYINRANVYIVRGVNAQQNQQGHQPAAVGQQQNIVQQPVPQPQAVGQQQNIVQQPPQPQPQNFEDNWADWADVGE